MSDYSNNARVNIYINGQSGTAEIEKLERKMIKLGKEINRVGKDSPMGKKLQSELRTAQVEANKLASKFDLTKMSIRQLASEASRLKRLRDMAQPGTLEFKRLNIELQKVNTQLGAVNGRVTSFKENSRTAFSSFKSLPVLLSVASIGAFFRKAITGASEVSDQMADIRKTTQMTKEEVDQLNESLAKIDTRTSRKELRDMAIVAGQIGLAKQDVEGFVKSVDIANVALGDEFSGGAEEVAQEMGKLRNVFTDIKSAAVDKDILSISNALNELSASGFATAPVVSENANRIGGYGIQVGLTTGQVLGLAAAQQELNIKSERGSTAIVKILQRMLTNVEDFASIAGVSVSDFQQQLDTDLFGAFMKVVEGSKEAGASNTKLAAIIKELEVDGAGASEVMAKFGGNVELIKEKVELASTALKSQSSIMEEFRLKNENAAAAASKIGKALSGWFEDNFVAAAGSFLVWLGKTTGLMEKMSETTEKERMELLLMEVKLKDVNLKHEDRVKLINELQAKYPDYLGSLDAEKVTNEELSKAISLTNEQLINKIILQRKDEQLTDKNEKAAKASIKRLESEENLRRKIAEIKDKTGLDIIEGTSIQQAEDLMTKMVEAPKASSKLYEELNNQILELKRLSSFEKQSIEASNQVLSEREALMKQLGITMDDVYKKTPPPTAAATSGETGVVTGGTSADKPEEALKLSVDLQITELNRYKSALAKFNTEVENLYKSKSEIAVLEATRESDELISINESLQSEMMNVISFGDAKQRQFAQKKMAELLAEETDLKEQRAQKAYQAEKAVTDARLKARQDAAARITSALQTEQEREVAQVETHYADLIALAIEYGIDYAQLVEAREQIIAQIRAKYQDQEQADFQERSKAVEGLISQYSEAALGILSPVVDLVANSSEKMIAEIEDATDKRLENLQDMRSRGIITEEQYQKRKLDLEKRTQKEIGAQRKKQIIADRIFAQAQVAFNTAETVAKAWSKSPETYGLPWSAAAIVMGALQSAAIWSADIPEYSKGGIHGGVPTGPSHANGGISLINSQTGQKEGEMQGGEPYMILSKETYANNGPLIDALLNASMNEGGKALTLDSISTGMPRFNMPNAVAASTFTSSSYARGGVFNGSSGNGTPAWVHALMDEIRMSREERKTPMKAYTILRDTDETKSELDRVRQYADIGSSRLQNVGTLSGKNGRNGLNGSNGRNGSVWYNGSGDPSDDIGVNGDYYLNNDSKDYYIKQGGTWGI